MTTCTFPDCGRPKHARDLCQTHTKQLSRGKPLTPIGSYAKRNSHSGCSFPDCDRPHRAKGLCSSHYDAQNMGRPLRALPSLDDMPTRQSREGTCDGPNCDRPIDYRRLCSAHAKQRSRGVPLTTIGSTWGKRSGQRRRKPTLTIVPDPTPEPPRTDWTVLLHQPKPSHVSKRSNSPLEASQLAMQPLPVTPAMERRAALVARSLGWDDDLLTMLGINQEQAA